MIHAQLCDHVNALCDALHQVSRIAADGGRCWCNEHDRHSHGPVPHSEACRRARVALEEALLMVGSLATDVPGYGFGV